MKKQIFILISMLLTLTASAYNAQIGGIYYSFDPIKKNAIVTCKNNYADGSGDSDCKGNIKIPNEVTYNNVTYRVTSIGKYAFSGCSELLSIDIPNSVTSIGNSAFSGCKKLTSIIIPNSVSIINGLAFINCSGLSSISIPSSVKSIGNKAFHGCSSLSSVIIPDGVTKVDYGTFYDCSHLTSVTIPNSVTIIDEFAFSGCKELATIEIPIAVTTIGKSAFSGCTNLASIAFPNSVTTIGKDAFYNCKELLSISIPNSVTSIGEGAFQGCTELKEVTISSNSIISKDYDTSNSIKSIFGTHVSCYILSEGIQSIGGYAFYGCSDLSSIIIPNSVEKIGHDAFNGCVGLKNITIPNSVSEIGNNTFMNCSELSSIEISNTLNIIESEVFSGCSNLASISIPNTITNIKDKAFYNCNNLKEVIIDSDYILSKDYRYDNGLKSIFGYQVENYIINNSVKNIGTYTFYGCKNLTSIELPNSLTSIGAYAFSFCEALETIVIPNSVTTIGDCAFSGCKSLELNVLPNSLSSIGESAFSSCTGLTSIEIPNSVNTIGNNTFAGCSNLKEVTINSNYIMAKDYKSNKGLKSIFGTQVTSYILGNQIKKIGAYAFYGCTNLTSVKLSDPLNSIGNHSFSGCTGLKSIEIPNSVKKIEQHAFSYCSELKSINIPNSVTTIGAYALSGCTALTSIIIPNSVTTIKEFLLSYCSGLTSISIPNSITEIEEYAFASCIGLSSIEIPKSVTKIGWGAFSGCTGLVSMNIPKSVTIIENYLFSGCTNITSVIIPNTIVNIGYEAFYGCSGLTSIEISGSVKSIGGNAFSGCSGLTSIEFPGSITSIGSAAFSGTSIEEVTFMHTKEEMDKLYWSGTDASDFKGPVGTTLKFSDDVKAKTGRSYFRYRPDAFSFWMVENPSCFEGINEEGYIEGHFVKMTVGNDPIWLPVNGKVDGNNYSLTGRASFTGYKSIQASLLDGSIEGILDLTEVNSRSDGSGNKYKIISIGFEAFRGMPITQVTLPETLQELGGSSLRETNLKYVVIPNSLTSIGGTINKTSDQFRGCTNLKTVVLGKSVESIGEVVFSKCDNLEMVVSLPMTPPTLDESTFRYSLTTETTFEGHPYGIIVHNDALEKYQNAEYWKDLVYFQSFNTTPVYLKQDISNLRGTSAQLLYYPIDEAHNYGEIPNGEEFLINGLEPNTSQSGLVINWKTKDGNFGTAILDVKTTYFTIETNDAKALSTTKARLLAIADEADDVEHYGFEWRQYDAPEGRPSNKVSAPLYNGRIVGTLNNLNPDKDYKYRPFYKSDSGEMYYGEWMWLYTGDANIYFEPEVYTKDAEDITKVSALLAGVWFEGTDDILEKGFEYWTIPNTKTRAVGIDVKKVTVSGKNVTTTLEGLKAGATYGFRSYAKTASGTTYGEEKTFKTILIGDANDDGELTDADVKAIACHILGNTPTEFNKKMADVNGDNKVNVADIVELNNLIGK